MCFRAAAALIIILLMTSRASPAHGQGAELAIGVIQGASDVSPYLNRFVSFRGVVVGRYEDQNTRGDVYYTLFVQDLPEKADGDPATSDGIAVFLGREPRPDIALGARVWVGGKVTEFFGLTEIDDAGLVVAVEQSTGALPPPVIIDPPAEMVAQAAYFEALESMRVAYGGPVIVAGPTHEGCGFAVIGEVAAAELPTGAPHALRRADDDPVGRVVPVLYPSDKDCDDNPQVKTGDRILGMAGALTYNFDQFKIVFDSADQLTIEPSPLPQLPALPPVGPQQIVIASINAEDYFDTTRDTDHEGEPVLTAAELVARQAKLSHAIAALLGCPTLVALQEIEHGELLVALSAALAGPCGFAYEVSHLDSPDGRGIDNALLSDPRRARIGAVTLRQTCSPAPTEVIDPAAGCGAGEYALFGRPPLQVDAHIDGEAFTLFVNHFKSKRGGEIETDLERIRQAVYLNGLAAALLAADPAARVVALGDFNDTDLSPALALLSDSAQGGALLNALAGLPPEERYTFNFGGVVELIDTILLSPALVDELGWAAVLHSNANFPVGWRLDTSPERLPFRATDHDMPVVALGPPPEPVVIDTPTAAPMPTAAPAATATEEPPPQPLPTTPPSPAATSEATIVSAVVPVPSHSGDRTLVIVALLAGLALALAAVVWRHRG